MFNNLGIFSRRMRIRRPVVVRPRPIVQVEQIGNDIFYNNSIPGSQGYTGSRGYTGSQGYTGSAGSVGIVPVTDVTTPTYTALSTDYYLCVLTNGLVTITLPVGILGTVYIIKDCFGNAFNFPITVQGTGQTVDGSTATVNTNFGSITVVFNGSDWSIV